MESYHGTSAVNAASLSQGNVDVTRGGGELGRGFYTGEHIHEAKQWAFHTTGDMQSNVVGFNTDDPDVEDLDIELLDYRAALLARHFIREKSITRTHLFERDLVWAPIVGSAKVSGDQFKWESTASEQLLNGTRTGRRVI